MHGSIQIAVVVRARPWAKPVVYQGLATMKPFVTLILLYLLGVTSCSPPTSGAFLARFNPGTTLSKIGTPAGISYSNGSMGTSASKGLFRGVGINKDWKFYFQGTHAQLSDQLDRFRAEVDSQLSSSDCVITGRGTWSGDFSGFSFDYTTGGRSGFIRVTGVTFESGRQGFEILAYEH